MKCSVCGSEWTSSVTYNAEDAVCPFCHAALKPKDDSVRETLRWIVDTRSIDVFLNAGIINSILADMAKSNDKERQKIKLALSAGVGSEFHRIWTKCRGHLSDSNIQEITLCLEKSGFAENFTSYVVDTLLYAVGCPSAATAANIQSSNTPLTQQAQKKVSAFSSSANVMGDTVDGHESPAFLCL